MGIYLKHYMKAQGRDVNGLAFRKIKDVSFCKTTKGVYFWAFLCLKCAKMRDKLKATPEGNPMYVFWCSMATGGRFLMCVNTK